MIKDFKFVFFSSVRFKLSALTNGYNEIFFELNTFCEKVYMFKLAGT